MLYMKLTLLFQSHCRKSNSRKKLVEFFMDSRKFSLYHTNRSVGYICQVQNNIILMNIQSHKNMKRAEKLKEKRCFFIFIVILNPVIQRYVLTFSNMQTFKIISNSIVCLLDHVYCSYCRAEQIKISNRPANRKVQIFQFKAYM